jgi:phosphohistidine swiveling domain-containing protein
LLDARAIQAIRESVFQAEELLGSAADIEWAHDGQHLSILQARPITTTDIPPVVRSFTEQECIVQFRARGIRTLLAEILYAAYLPLGHLFLSDGDQFRQYAPKVSVKQTLERGTTLLRDVAAFESFIADLFQYLAAAEESLERMVGAPLTGDSLATSFRMMSGVIERYSRMDFIYTDDAVLLESSEPDIAASLQLLKQTKDAIRERINGLFFGERSPLQRLVSLIATARGKAPSDLHHCRSHELVLIVAEQSAQNPDVESRRRAYAFLPAHRAPVYLAGDNALHFMSTFSGSSETPHGSELQGVVASRGDGSVVGFVRLINVDYSDPLALAAAIGTMQEGEILVAETTAPELTEACDRARAIVTDLGGRLSHAAIVSRERHIPCIVATQHATDIFRSGDLVEVNVESGRVKRLNPDPVRDAADSQGRSAG